MASKHIQNLENEVSQAKAALANRWRDLELEVSGLANTAKEEVSQGIQEAKESVSISHQVAKRPWTMVAGSIATGICLSRLSGIRSLAVIGLAGPIFKTVFDKTGFDKNSYSDPIKQTVSPSLNLKGGLETSQSSQRSFMETVQSKAINSLVDITRELVKRNIPASFAPLVDEAIVRSVESFKSSAPHPDKIAESKKRLINEQGASVPVH